MLRTSGNPYVLSADDLDGRVGIDWGTTGVPETYVIDAAGIIRHKHSGPLNPRVWEGKIAPLLKDLGA
jgi:cytochrome c biogenesis protein CcmG/thiol:disulfide interchange protein DsbE